MKRFDNIPLFDSYQNSDNNQNNYLFYHNNELVTGNVTIDNLVFDKDITVSVYRLYDQDCDCCYQINSNVNVHITEINYYCGEVKVNKKINCLDDSVTKFITIDNSDSLDSIIKINVNNFINNKAYLNNMKLATVSTNLEYNENTLLNGVKAKNETFNVMINNCNKKHQFNFETKHQNIDTQSQMINYAIAKGNSVLDINTNGYVTRGAIRSNINQKTKGILIDEFASISANPWLQIDDYDCLASHGAGIGAIDNEELFYLMSRGLTSTESSELIIKGFVNPIFEEIKNVTLKEKLMNLKI